MIRGDNVACGIIDATLSANFIRRLILEAEQEASGLHDPKFGTPLNTSVDSRGAEDFYGTRISTDFSTQFDLRGEVEACGRCSTMFHTKLNERLFRGGVEAKTL